MAEAASEQPTRIRVDELAQHVGRRVGASAWHTITQEQVDGFADATGDHQWIHVDPERARAGPFGRTIAHGFLTLSLGPALLAEAVTVEGASMTVNYGLERVRFPAPVPVGTAVRGLVTCEEVTPVSGGTQVRYALEVEGSESDKPVCVAQVLLRYYH